MRNYLSRIPLGNDKYAYDQAPVFAEAAEDAMRNIKKRWKRPLYFYHLRRGGHVAAVRSHLGSDFFGKIDLRRFYEQVSRNRIIKRLRSLGLDLADATDIAVQSTVLSPVKKPCGGDHYMVPYGFVQSALLASIDMDKSQLGRVMTDIDKSDLNLSVYVDDIVVSGSDETPVSAALNLLREAAATSHFPINEEKSCDVRDTMNAFNIEFRNGHMAISQERMEEFQGQIMLSGDDDTNIAILAYVHSVNQTQAQDLFDALPRYLSCAAHILL